MTKRLFRSRLAVEFERFIAFKRALGLKYESQVFILRSFDRFVARHAPRRGQLPYARLLRDWLGCKEGRKPRTVAVHLSLAREFFRYLGRSDPSVFVPGRDWGPWATGSRFVPRILSQAEVRGLLRATKRLAGPRWRGRTFHMLVLLLYCTGLRFGEALRLTIDDVDLEQRVLRVRESKRKTRLVPFRDDLARELTRYHRARPSTGRTDASFLCQPDGRPYGLTTASGVVRRLLRELGLKPPRGRIGPRPFDLRHSFAVRRLTCWYKAGADLQAKLPLLSAYMGHDDLLGTERYLRATPELLATASRRFAARTGMGVR